MFLKTDKQKLLKYEIDAADDTVFVHDNAIPIGVHLEEGIPFLDALVPGNDIMGHGILTRVINLLILKPGQSVPSYVVDYDYQLLGQLIKTDQEMIGPDVLYVFWDKND